MPCKRSAYGTPHTLTTTLVTVVSVLCTILLDHSQCSPCTRTFESTVKLKNVRRDVNTGIRTSTHVTLSATQCSCKCTGNSSVSFYYAKIRRECLCNSDLDINTGHDPSKPELVYGVYVKVIKTTKCDNSTTLEIKPDTMDCLDLHNKGFSEDGAYTIYPQPGTPVSAWCNMSDGGCWTVIQRRMNGDEDFYRNWHDYKFGFGNPEREYWLGLENVHFLTQKPSEISIQMVAFGDKSPLSCISNYSHFNVFGESENYRISILNFSGTCGDPFLNSKGLSSTNNKRFSTFDRDNDNHEANCAKDYHGAWWYNYCMRCNLNGRYRPQGAVFPSADGIVAIPIWGLYYSLKETVMKFRRLDQGVDS